MRFNQSLSKFRERTGLTQKEVVQRLNQVGEFESLTVVSYHRWETGKVTPHVKKQALIYMILAMKEELRYLCQENGTLDSVIKKFDSKRWIYPTINYQDPYDFKKFEDLTITTVYDFDDIPNPVLLLHDKLYYSKNKIPQYRVLYEQCNSSFVTYYHDSTKIYGHYAMHHMSIKLLIDYMKTLQVDTFNDLEEALDLSESVVFISSDATTRKDINLDMKKSVFESIFEMKIIPKYTFVRVYTSEFNQLAENTLEPILTVADPSRPHRIRKGNEHYSWLGYLIPTHLLLLFYGVVSDQLLSLTTE